MQKLSRTEKYRDYRNKLKNGNEREIATKELQQLQEKIIFNEKRFGDSSRTESDLNRGRRDTSSSIDNQIFDRPSQNQSKDYLNDIFDQLNRYKNGISNQNNEETENRDDYIKKIRDIVYRPETQEEIPAPKKEADVNDRLLDLEKLVIKENRTVEKEPVVEQEPVFEQESIPVDFIEPEENDDFIDFSQFEEEPVIEDLPIEEEPITSQPSFEDTKPEPKQIIEEKPVAEAKPITEEKPVADAKPITEEKQEDNPQKSFEEELRAKLNLIQNEETPKSQEQKEPITAEFVEEKPVELPKSQLEDVQIKKADIQPTIPQHDHSKEFEEICMNVNSLAEEIDSADTFARDQYVPPVATHKPENSFEGIQQNIKKDLIGVEKDNNFFDNLEKEINHYNNDEENTDAKPIEEKSEDKKKIITKSEISSEMKEEFDNTVSLQVDKLLGEINASKADNISATDIMKNNDKAKKVVNDQPGKTIAFEVKHDDIPDNTVVLTNPKVEDTSIRTMSFKTEDLEVEDAGKGNTVLNIILSILIVIAVGALGVIVYFFLITRGII